MGFLPSWGFPKRPRARWAGRCLSLGKAGLLSQGSAVAVRLQRCSQGRVMKSGVSVRKLEEKGGASGLRPARENCWQTPEWAAARGDGRTWWGHPPHSPSLVLWEAAPAALACSQGSFVLQEKLWLPAVRALMLHILCKTACFKGCILGEAALQVWQRSLQVAGALQSSRDVDYTKIHTLAYLQL